MVWFKDRKAEFNETGEFRMIPLLDIADKLEIKRGLRLKKASKFYASKEGLKWLEKYFYTTDYEYAKRQL